MVFKRTRELPDGNTVEVSPYWYYRFMRNGVPVYINTKQKNKTTAQEMEAEHRTRLAKDEAGLKRGQAPTLKQFGEQFLGAIEIRCFGKDNTVDFYRGMFKGLVAFPPLANARLDRIDEALIEKFVQYREPGVARATVNRHLATLRRALRLAQEWKIINRVPRIRLLSGERIREFVIKQEHESEYLRACPQPLRDAAALILETGLRVDEALQLRWEDVHLQPGVGKKFGFVTIRRGKTKNARRSVSLTARAIQMLLDRQQQAVNGLVFPGDSLVKPFLGSSLAHQHAVVRANLGLPKDFVVHSLRHTMLTRLGEAGADAFTIMRIAGHSSITVSQRYVHPSDDAMEAAFEKLGAALGHKKAKAAIKVRKRLKK